MGGGESDRAPQAVAIAGSDATIGVLGTESSIVTDDFDASSGSSSFSLDGAARTAVGGDAIDAGAAFDASSTLAALP